MRNCFIHLSCLCISIDLVGNYIYIVLLFAACGELTNLEALQFEPQCQCDRIVPGDILEPAGVTKKQ